MAINSLGTALSGLRANQFRQDVSANNVANVNTDGFKASTVQSADAAYVNSIGQGTRVTGTYAPPQNGPVAQDVETAAGYRELSNTDMVTEMTGQIAAHNAYGANMVVMKTADQANQVLIDLKG